MYVGLRHSEIYHLSLPLFLKPNCRILEHNVEVLDLQERVPTYALDHMP